ncbi:nitroreductase family protein, partial [Candidatus Bipolaricaulota bacterium]|nr:nitroreductase family protein [Candidatus Bipolaricaulota bacterium]
MDANRLLPEIEARFSCRAYLPDPIPTDAIQRILDAGARAPSGANQQPWHMIVVDNPELKSRIRVVCERADQAFHDHANSEIQQWMKDRNITTEKPFLTEAPALIAVFYDPKNPYPLHSVWIAISFMLLQATREGLGTLTYTPSAANVKDLLSVPDGLQMAAILPVGKP